MSEQFTIQSVALTSNTNIENLCLVGFLGDVDLSIEYVSSSYIHEKINKTFLILDECEDYIHKLLDNKNRYFELKYILTPDELKLIFNDDQIDIYESGEIDNINVNQIKEVEQLRYILWRNDKRHQFNSKNELIGYLIDYIDLDIFIKE